MSDAAFFLLLLAIAALAAAILLFPLWRGAKAQQRVFILLCFCLLTLCPLVLYSWLGAPRILPLLAARDAYFVQMDAAAAKAQALVQKHPDDPAAWAMFATVNIEREHYDEAAGDARKAVLLSKGAPAMLVLFGRAQVLQANGKVTPDAAKAFRMALLQEPKNPQARFFLAVQKMQTDNAAGAKADLEKLLADLPPDSELTMMVRRKLDEIRPSAAPMQ
jgi:cytochrome c-type biogenesis protein CcmH